MTKQHLYEATLVFTECTENLVENALANAHF